MATPREAAVIAAARAMREADRRQEDLGGPCDDLMEALEALDGQGAPTAGLPLTWAEVVTTDEVLSKNGQWYEVLEVRADEFGRVVVRLVGVGKPQTYPGSKDVRVRRSEMGQAVDVMNTILYSGPS